MNELIIVGGNGVLKMFFVLVIFWFVFVFFLMMGNDSNGVDLFLFDLVIEIVKVLEGNLLVGVVGVIGVLNERGYVFEMMVMVVFFLVGELEIDVIDFCE